VDTDTSKRYGYGFGDGWSLLGSAKLENGIILIRYISCVDPSPAAATTTDAAFTPGTSAAESWSPPKFSKACPDTKP